MALPLLILLGACMAAFAVDRHQSSPSRIPVLVVAVGGVISAGVALALRTPAFILCVPGAIIGVGTPLHIRYLEQQRRARWEAEHQTDLPASPTR